MNNSEIMFFTIYRVLQGPDIEMRLLGNVREILKLYERIEYVWSQVEILMVPILTNLICSASLTSQCKTNNFTC